MPRLAKPARRLLLCLPLAAAIPAHAQTVLYAVRPNGDILHINEQTGAADLIGASGQPASAISAYHHGGGRFDPTIEYLITASPGMPAQLRQVNRWTGTIGITTQVSGIPAGYTVRATAKYADTETTIYALLKTPGAGNPDLLATIQQNGGACTVIGTTGRADLEGLAVTQWTSNGIYALSPANDGTLCLLNPTSGAATELSRGGFGDSRSLVFFPTGQLLACGSNLLSVDTVTGAPTPIGPTGYGDIADMTIITTCYANCDTGSMPVLNVLDFNCFLNHFAAGSAYANCDFSTTPPILNVLDFNCFLNRFSAGCSAP
jgi:hypothetical protein